MFWISGEINLVEIMQTALKNVIFVVFCVLSLRKCRQTYFFFKFSYFLLFQCHVSVVPIYSCLKTRTLKEFSKAVLIAILICVLTYTGTASFGYLTFGSDVNEDILLSYEPTTDVLIAVILIAFKMYTTYPILLFVGR